MLFYTPLFLFIFLPVTLATNFAIRSKWREVVLLGWSALFYFWGEPRFFGIAVLSAIADYFICNQIYKSTDKWRARNYMAIGVSLNVIMLAYFKYTDFFLSSVNVLLNSAKISSLPLLHVALPIGVSFIVFEKITYLVDVYRGVGEPARSLRSYLLYVLLFPKLLAGPIVKYHDIAAQLTTHHQSVSGFFIGFERFLLGLIKKVLIADALSEVVDSAFAIPIEYLGFTSAWLGIICFTLQIYFDFSGYSDMAIGLARMFGFRLLENFNLPYIATSFTDFWRRWHISLSTWIKEYLYISLGGNRQGILRTYVNLFVCFVISGLWHGASWTFVLWGLYHGFFLVLDKLFWLKFSQRVPRLLKIALTLLLIMIGWTLFRSSSLAQFAAFITATFSPGKEGSVIFLTADLKTAIVVASLWSLIPAIGEFDAVITAWRSLKVSRVLESLVLSSLAFITLGKTITVTFNPFLYFRF